MVALDLSPASLHLGLGIYYLSLLHIVILALDLTSRCHVTKYCYFFRPAILGEPMHDHIPPNTWQPMSPQKLGQPRNAGPHSLGNQIPLRSGDIVPSAEVSLKLSSLFYYFLL